MKAFRIITILIIPLLLLCIMQRADAQGLRSTAYGDVNSNGKVGTDDVVLVLRYCIGLTPFYFEQFIRGDVNCDGRINTQDANLILRYSAGMLNEMPYGVPTGEYRSEFSFVNYSFPGNDERVSYKRSRELNGIILSRYPLLSVSVQINDVSRGKTEIFETVYFDANSYVLRYSTNESMNSLNDKVRFSQLSAGKKELIIICSSTNVTNEIVYSSTFSVGYTMDEIAPYCYNLSGELSSGTAYKILSLLNSLDLNYSKGAAVIAEGTKHLGEPYELRDCSSFVRYVAYEALGLDLPRQSVEQAVYCEENGLLIPSENKQPGDLIFMRKTYCDCGRYHEIHHVAIYIGTYGGNDYLLESTSRHDSVVMRRVWGLSDGSWTIDSIARIA